MKQKIVNIGVHHFAGQLNLSQLNQAHKARWADMPSELRPDLWIGYNFVIWKDGTWTQARYIGEETCAQQGHNFDTVSICLAGNFTRGVEMPTDAQKKTLQWMATGIILNTAGFAVKAGTTINIQPSNIYPHRVLQPNHTECYGSALPDNWAQTLVYPASLPEVVTIPTTHITDPSTPRNAPTGENVDAIKALLRMIIALYQELILKKKAELGGLSTCLHSDVRG